MVIQMRSSFAFTLQKSVLDQCFNSPDTHGFISIFVVALFDSVDGKN